MNTKCTHEASEKDTACADGMCPLCMSVELDALRAALDVAKELIDHQTPDGFIQYMQYTECIACDGDPEQGHAEGCKYVAFIAKLEAAK